MKIAFQWQVSRLTLIIESARGLRWPASFSWPSGRRRLEDRNRTSHPSCPKGHWINFSIFSSLRRFASNSETRFPCPGTTKSGATSFNGQRTNFRRCARGWGRIKSGDCRTCLPNTIKSRSSARGSFKTFLGRRPNSFSRVCNFCNSDSGVSEARG